MKLFSEAKPAATGGEDKSTSRQKKMETRSQAVVIISPRPAMLSEIASHLLMHNVIGLIEVADDFLTLQSAEMTSNAAVVIIDIVDCDDIAQLHDKVIMLIPTQARVFIIGDNDSIAFAGSLMQTARLPYLHAGSQLAQLAGCIKSKEAGQAPRSTIVMSVLGCKGGAGASTIALRLFQALGKLATIPVLLVQGASGSRDLDLLMEQALPVDGASFPLSSHQSVYMETTDTALNYHDPRFNQFNLVFIDHLIQSLSHEQLDLIISRSHTLILVVTRELASIRMAKKVLDEQDRRARGGVGDMRILICLNENRPVRGRELKNSDIEEYLEHEISVVNPYDGKNAALTSGSPLFRFAAYLLGKPAVPATGNKLLAMFRRDRSLR